MKHHPRRILPPTGLLPVAVLAVALCACTSSQDVLEPSALVGGAPTPRGQASALSLAASPAMAATPEQPATQPGALAAIATDARIQFAPVVGAPASATAPLSGRLAATAGARGLALVGAGDASATHVMKGYFSAISEGGETTIIYVWDVMDPAGTRVHRIQGQTKAPSGGRDGWDTVPASTMEAIADETVARLASWLAARPGQG